VDYDAVKHALVVYVLKKDEQLSAELDQLVFNIASETGFPTPLRLKTWKKARFSLMS